MGDRIKRPEVYGNRSGNAEKTASSSDRVICQETFFLFQYTKGCLLEVGFDPENVLAERCFLVAYGFL